MPKNTHIRAEYYDRPYYQAHPKAAQPVKRDVKAIVIGILTILITAYLVANYAGTPVT
jgi:hypothetical protein